MKKSVTRPVEVNCRAAWGGGKCFLGASVLGIGLLLVACGDRSAKVLPSAKEAAPAMALQRAAPSEAAKAATASLSREASPSAGAMSSDAASSAPAQRFIALRHALTLETSPDKLKQVYENLVAWCVPRQCDLLGATYVRETDGNAASASIDMRIQPAATDGFITGLSQQAEVLAHQRSSEDRTDQVVDVEAQLKNLVQLRDQLRAMLIQKTGSLKDTLDVQRELANTQSRLDSLAGARKALANETEKVAVSISLQTRKAPLTAQVWAPLKEAWQGMTGVMATSLALIITFLAAILPGLAIGLPLLWLGRRLWRWRRNRG